MLKYLLVNLLLIGSLATYSQIPLIIKGRVIDQEGKSIPNATVETFFGKKKVSVGMTDSAGGFTLSLIKENADSIVISSVGYNVKTLPIPTISSSPLDLGTIVLQLRGNALSTITINSNIPAIQIQADRKTLNLEKVLTVKGASVLDLLEQVPGVLVNRATQTVEINGRSGVLLYIDGKPTQVSAQDLNTYLASINGNGVSSIEIIDKPSARYEVQGNAGIINLVTKKSKLQKSGNVTLGGGVGRFEKLNGGARIELPLSKKVYINVGYDFLYNKNFTEGFYSRIIQNNIYLVQDYLRLQRDRSHNSRLAVDYSLNPRHNFSLELRHLRFSNNAELTTESYFNTLTNKDIDSLALQDNNFKTNRINTTFNASYQWRIDTIGQNLSISGGLIEFKNSQMDEILNQFYYDESQQVAIRQPLVLSGNTPVNIKISAGQVDYEKFLFKKFKIETGVRHAFTDIGSTVVFASGSGSTLSRDERFSAALNYSEQISAGYTNLNWRPKRINLNAGFRVESWRIDGVSSRMSESIRRKTVQLFPSMNASFPLGKQNQMSIAFTKRINRPGFQGLNPAINFVSYYSTYQGNPLLQPEISTSASWSLLIKKRLNFELIAADIENPVTYSFFQNDQSKIQEVSLINFDKRRSYTFTSNLQSSINKSWRVIWSTAFNYSEYLFGDFSNDQFSFNTNIRNSLALPKKFSAELTLAYFSSSVYGYLKNQSYVNVSLGIQKELGRYNINFASQDILQTMRFNNTVRFGNLDVVNQTMPETQVFRITVTRQLFKTSISNSKLKRSMQDEERRVGS